MGKTFRRNAKHTPVEHRRRKVKEELPDATPLVESLSESFQSDDEDFTRLVQDYRAFMTMRPNSSIDMLLESESKVIEGKKKGSRNSKEGNLPNPDGDGSGIITGTWDRVLEDVHINFRQLNREIKEFVKKADIDEELELEPYNPIVRRLVLELAHMYKLNTRNDGIGIDRHCVLIRTGNASVPSDFKRLDRFLEKAQRSVDFFIQGPKKDRSKKTLEPGKSSKSSKGRALSMSMASGTAIGEDARPIEDNNVGNRMLRKLGWSPGQGLGTEKSGCVEPIKAVFKGNRSGLGN